MDYNLSPFINALELDNPNYKNWVHKIEKFFDNEHADPKLQDDWYDYLLEDIHRVKELMKLGYLIDDYTAIATFDDTFVGDKNSFNMAHYIQRNYDKFIRRNVMTLTGDYGITNIQLQLCGVKIVSSIMDRENITGSILTTILNEGFPYPINHYHFPKEDIIIACSVFDSEERAWKNWQALLDQRAQGKEVYFTSNTFSSLKSFIDYDIIELIESPLDVYEAKDIEDLRYGYTHKIYRIR